MYLPANLELRKLMESAKADLRVAVRAEMSANRMPMDAQMAED